MDCASGIRWNQSHPDTSRSSGQDWTYFPTTQDSMIAGSIHVSDADDRRGCLRVYPGSHRLTNPCHPSVTTGERPLRMWGGLFCANNRPGHDLCLFSDF